jgi:hypothetical protein
VKKSHFFISSFKQSVIYEGGFGTYDSVDSTLFMNSTVKGHAITMLLLFCVGLCYHKAWEDNALYRIESPLF